MADNDEGGGSETLIRLSPPSRSITRSMPVSWSPPTISRSFPLPISRFYCLSKASRTTPPLSTPPQLPSFFILSSRHSVRFEIVDYIDTTAAVAVPKRR
ncbi:hypothetical protein ACFX2I_006579 [Malus domestica]